MLQRDDPHNPSEEEIPSLNELLDRFQKSFQSNLDDVVATEGGFKFEEANQRACAAALTIVQLLPNLFPGNGHAIDLESGKRVEINNGNHKQDRNRYPPFPLVEACKKCVGEKREITIYINFRNITVAPQENEIEFIKDFLRQVYSP